MGSGKSTLAGLAAARLGRQFYDLDEIVVQSAGRSIPEIFAAEGEAGFRSRELAAMESLPPGADLVVATGGGIVETPAAVAGLKIRGDVVWLDLAWSSAWHRLRTSGHIRPLVRTLTEAELKGLFERRLPLYKDAANYCLPSDRMTIDQLVEQVMEIIPGHETGTVD